MDEPKKAKKLCLYCEEVADNWTDSFEGVKHHLEFKPDNYKDSRFYHRDTHIYETNGKAVLDVENYQYLIKYCPYCGRKLGGE